MSALTDCGPERDPPPVQHAADKCINRQAEAAYPLCGHDLAAVTSFALIDNVSDDAACEPQGSLHAMMNLKCLVVVGLAAAAPLSALAQVNCSPTYGGGSRCTDAYGNVTNTTPTYGGGYRTTDQNGNARTATPTYGGGYRTTDQNGNSSMTTPTYGGGYRTTDQSGNARTTTPTYGGGYRTTDQNGNSVTCTPTYGGGYRCN